MNTSNAERDPGEAPARGAPGGWAIAFLDRHALGGVLLLAAVVRVGHLLAQFRLPLFDGLMIDSKLYDQWAQKIAAGEWLGGDRAFFMDPLYPYVLALFYRCFGHDLLVVRLFQAALGVATCGLAAAIGRRVGGRAIGTIAALLLALYQPLVFEGGEIEKTALGVCLLSAALALALREGIASRFAAGACLAAASLARGNLLLMAPLGALYFLADTTPDESGSLPSGPARSAAVFLLGFALALSPVLWRNHRVSGQWILTTSQAGANFYLGNNPTNASGAFSPLPFVRPSPAHEEEDFRTQAETLAGKSLTPSEVSAFWFHRAIDHIGRNPGFAALVGFRKLTLFFSNLEVPDGWSMYFLRRYSPALRTAFLTFGWLLPFAVLGGATSFRRDRRVRLLVGFLAAYALSLVVFYVHSRYRVYALPAVAVLSALGLRWVFDRVLRREWRVVLPAALAAGCACVFSFAGASVFVGLRAGDYVMNYAHLASLYEDRGDFRSAEALLREGLERQPGTASLLCGLAAMYLRTDDPARALELSRQCLQANEYYLDAWFVSGQANEALGNLEQAKRCYLRQLEIVPGHQFAGICLRNLMAREERVR
jgi:4-amino-4-deoxy-L-arabinose transferase-like glycosyltransferase